MDDGIWAGVGTVAYMSLVLVEYMLLVLGRGSEGKRGREIFIKLPAVRLSKELESEGAMVESPSVTVDVH